MNITNLIQEKDQATKYLFLKAFPLYPIPREDQVEERIKHLQELFGDHNKDYTG